MELSKISLAWILVVSFSSCSGLDNGLALTPPMGWMHWQRYRCVVDCELYPDDCISEKLFKKTADLMVSDGYLDAGYEYVMIDDCWMSFERDPKTLRLQPNATRFPSGMKALSKYIHSKGLKFGIYADYGTHTCGGYPGSLNYLDIDAQTFADWDVDYLKFDGCYVDIDEMEDGYAAMSKFLNKTGRPIVFSCSWPAYMEPSGIRPNYTALAQHCNLWRNWDDIDDSWQSVSSIMKWFGKNQDRFATMAGPGHWNDPDMLLVGNFGLSFEQSKSQLSVWAILAAPLIMSVDLKEIRPELRELLLNKDVIEINQDALGKQGSLVLEKNNISIWVRELTPVFENYSSYAIAFVSQRTDGYPYRVAVKPSKLGLLNADGYFLQDVFDHTERPITRPEDDIVVRVKPSGAVLLRAKPIVDTNSV
ncbi:alpha-galactosidase A [Coccinella septempunctata]|uniref:alpha-galactosidase A n=1 Tax=Coccinella septempunctata TaxID=41139 RepID=UPI001D079C45|nr:alpha-galactosidase A [Coccinella septempunctata]